MDFNTIWTIVTVIGLPVIGFLYNDLKKKLEKNAEDLTAHKLYTAENYVNKGELEQSVSHLSKSIDEVKAAMLRIEQYIFTGQIERRSN